MAEVPVWVLRCTGAVEMPSPLETPTVGGKCSPSSRWRGSAHHPPDGGEVLIPLPRQPTYQKSLVYLTKVERARFVVQDSETVCITPCACRNSFHRRSGSKIFKSFSVVLWGGGRGRNSRMGVGVHRWCCVAIAIFNNGDGREVLTSLPLPPRLPTCNFNKHR